MDKRFYFQSIIMALEEFWAERDCLIWQPYYSQVGAGTMNPATFLRVLGPEPWHVAYVEPSIRPDDGRYGDNPNRLQQFYQYQVILKPDPGNPQALYLESLQALGIDPAEHDIRFVEDNWQQPAIGAWGLGWEVWLNGQEITQFTYFQQCGGLDLEPQSVELTYGLERIAMTLQGVRHFKDIQWSAERTYGDVNLMGEREHSTYYFDVADVARVRKMYDIYEKEAELAIEAGLVLPAHDYVLKTSHAFNILDTRGAVGVTERQALFARTRDLARRVAEAYVAQRQEEEFPWQIANDTNTKAPDMAQALEEAPTQGTSPFVLEIGTEELPASDLTTALSQLESTVPELCSDLRLDFGAIRIEGTPRRLVVLIDDLAVRQTDQSLVVKGPPAARAFDQDGNPTRAGEGFARSKGVDVKDLKIETMDGGDYVVVRVEEKGQQTLVVLSEALSKLIAGIRFSKSMRWNESGIAFSRPIRWILALHGQRVVPFTYAGIVSDKMTRGLRFEGPREFSVDSPKDYLERLEAQGILLSPVGRQAEIKNQVDTLAEEVGGRVVDDVALLAEVNHMVEKPTAFRGSFNRSYLDILPPEVLISVMKKHQRYFVLEDASGNLLPYFIGVRNGGIEHIENVIDGNEQVILARFDDAVFFVQKDLQKQLEAFVPELKTLTFQVDLGSLLDKTERISKLTKTLGENLGLSQSELQTSYRAATLCKADLATNMVVEMTSLQGIMGKYYALKSGETPQVADAIFEHYLPRGAEDHQPKTKPGLVVGLADRLDSLMGLFAVGLAPTGTKDPFAQRRAALGICQNLIGWQVTFDLEWGLKEAGRGLAVDVPTQDVTDCLEFIQGRLRGMLLEMGFRYDVVDAIMMQKGHDPYGAYVACKELSAWIDRDDWDQILPAFSRCVRITRDLDERFKVIDGKFETQIEKQLFDALTLAEESMGETRKVDSFLIAFLPMIPTINAFFDEVLVMAEDEKTRQNRLGLLQRIASLTDGIIDMSFLEGF